MSSRVLFTWKLWIWHFAPTIAYHSLYSHGNLQRSMKMRRHYKVRSPIFSGVYLRGSSLLLCNHDHENLFYVTQYLVLCFSALAIPLFDTNLRPRCSWFEPFPILGQALDKGKSSSIFERFSSFGPSRKSMMRPCDRGDQKQSVSASSQADSMQATRSEWYLSWSLIISNTVYHSPRLLCCFWCFTLFSVDILHLLQDVDLAEPVPSQGWEHQKLLGLYI